MENLLDEVYFALKEEHSKETTDESFYKTSAMKCTTIFNERLNIFAKDLAHAKRCSNCKFVDNPCKIAQVAFYERGLNLDNFGCTECGLKLGTDSLSGNVVAEFEAQLSETWCSGQQRYYEFVTEKREVYEEQGKKYKITIQEIGQ